MLTRVHRAGRYGWRTGIMRRTWLVGVEWDLQADAWLIHLGPLALRVWRHR